MKTLDIVENFPERTFNFDKKLLEIDNLRNSITNIADLDIKRLRNSINPNSKLDIPLQKLKILKDNLELKYWEQIDPIEYIISLYFWEKKSIKTVWEELKQLGLLYESHDSLGRFLRSTLNWKLKLLKEWLDTSKVKSRIPTEGIESQRKLAEENRKNMLLWYIKNTNTVKNPEFYLNEYNDLKAMEKAEYLFKVFDWLDLKVAIKEIDYGSKVVLPFLQEKLDEITTSQRIKKVELTLFVVNGYLKEARL